MTTQRKSQSLVKAPLEAKGRKKNPTAKTETSDSVTLHVEVNPDKTIYIQWHIETEKPTVWDSQLRCNRNTGNTDFRFNSIATGCTGINAPRDGSFLDFGADIDPNNNFQTYSSPFKSGDNVTYQVVAFIVHSNGTLRG